MSMTPDLTKVANLNALVDTNNKPEKETLDMLSEARNFIEYFIWCGKIEEEYIGMAFPGIVHIFLFKIVPNKCDVDSWIWVIVGDLPPAYLTVDQCPNPATALDGYIGAMEDWVDAASRGASVAELIPVNVAANAENAKILKSRLEFLDSKILSRYTSDLQR